MNKAKLIEEVASKTRLTKKQVEEVIETILDSIMDALKTGDSVTLAGFGTFSAKIRHARKGVNPQKPSEKIDIPEVTIPKFKSGKALKDALKGK
ncbi:MAG TPA: HU family DNA-binding protein [Candidatus Uhrbacteria bacterium]|nr:HU family DNA-binding protein [Candidatus Uhrbacteria bacterium]